MPSLKELSNSAVGTPRSLLEAINNGVNTLANTQNGTIEHIHDHVKDYLAQRIQIVLMRAQTNEEHKAAMEIARALGFKL